MYKPYAIPGRPGHIHQPYKIKEMPCDKLFQCNPPRTYPDGRLPDNFPLRPPSLFSSANFFLLLQVSIATICAAQIPCHPGVALEESDQICEAKRRDPLLAAHMISIEEDHEPYRPDIWPRLGN